MAEAAGLPRDKTKVEKLIGPLGADPADAWERLQCVDISATDLIQMQKGFL